MSAERVPTVERARRYVEKLPSGVSGCNRHAATFHAAFILVHGFALPEAEAWSVLQEFNARCEPPSDEHKLRHRLERALRTEARERGWLLKGGEFVPGKGYRGRGAFRAPEERKAPEFSAAALARFAGSWGQEVDLLWLANRSAVDPVMVRPSRFLDLLYRAGDREKVLIFSDEFSQGDAVWPDDEIPAGGPKGIWFLAQPVCGEWRPNPRSLDKRTGEARMSRRSEESVMDWRFFVIESDQADVRQWLGALVQLPLRIAAIYSSGGRSVHALVRVDAGTKAQWDQKKAARKAGLVILGADPGAMSAVRLTRLPGCLREEKGALQKLLYVQPSPSVRPLIELPVVRDVEADWLQASATANEPLEMIVERLRFYAPVSRKLREELRLCESALTTSV